MTWWREDDRYGVFFNRDELKTRSRAQPPFLWSGGFLSPLDPASAGTWMAVNQDGLVLGLLNRWHESAKGTKSRGHIILALIHLKTPSDIWTALSSTNFADNSPFTLVAMDSQTIQRFDWDGQKLSKRMAEAPITSSSFRFEEVRERRGEAYRKSLDGPIDGHHLEEFHGEDSHGAYSVRMCRPDAQTWSRSRIEISAESINWEYAEEFSDFQKSPEIRTATLARSTSSA